MKQLVIDYCLGKQKVNWYWTEAFDQTMLQ